MRIQPAVLALTLAVLFLGACTSSNTSDPEPSETSPIAVETPVSVDIEVLATYDKSDIPGLNAPAFMAFDRQGRLYVVNGGNSEILVLSSEGEVLRRWGEQGTHPGQFDFLRDPDPRSALGGVAIAPDGSVYIAEAGNKRVQRLTADGRPMAVWGRPGRGNGRFLEPTGVAVAPSGEVFVVDDLRNDIQVFSADGKYRRTIGSPGNEPGQLSDTGNIRVGGEGTLVNADFGNGRVQAWDDRGTLLWTLGVAGTGPGRFRNPLDVGFGPDGSLLVVDDTRVQVFDPSQKLIGVWPDAPGEVRFEALAIDGDELWVEAVFPDKFFKLKLSRA